MFDKKLLDLNKVRKLSKSHAFTKIVVYQKKTSWRYSNVTLVHILFQELLWPIKVLMPYDHGMVMTTFYYCSVNYRSGLQRNTFSKLSHIFLIVQGVRGKSVFLIGLWEKEIYKLDYIWR